MMPCPYVVYIVFWSKVQVWQKYLLDLKVLGGSLKIAIMRSKLASQVYYTNDRKPHQVKGLK